MEEEKVKEVDCLELKWEVESLEEELWVWNISSNDEIFFQNSFGIFFTFWINFRKILKKKTPFLKKNGKIMKRNKNSNWFLYLQWNLHSAKSNKDNGKFIKMNLIFFHRMDILLRSNFNLWTSLFINYIWVNLIFHSRTEICPILLIQESNSWRIP